MVVGSRDRDGLSLPQGKSPDELPSDGFNATRFGYTSPMDITLPDGVGLIGVAMIVATYGLSQTGRMAIDKPAYPAINAVGAVLILISLYFRPNPASIVIEVFWLAISLTGMARTLLKSKPRGESGVADVSGPSGRTG